MSNDIYVIVEGDGEVSAAPVLVRRLLNEEFVRPEFNVPRAHNGNGRHNLLKPDGLERFLERLRRIADCKGAVVLLDAEEESRDCPPELAYALAERGKALNLPFPVVVVCAVCEYESWFLSNLHTSIKNWLLSNAKYEGPNPEMMCGAKEWLSRHMPSGRAYKETEDQARMTACIDIPHTIEHSRSFRRMAHAIEELLAAIDSGAGGVTPVPPRSEEN